MKLPYANKSESINQSILLSFSVSLFLSFFLSFLLSCVGVPVRFVPGVPASSRTFLTLFLLFYPHKLVCHPYVARTYSYVTRMLPVCTRMYSYYVIGVYLPLMLLLCSRMLPVCTRVVF